MLQASSHLVIATERVEEMTRFFSECFSQTPHFSNKEFSEFVLPSQFRIAFFKPVGKAAAFFNASGERAQVSFGLTVKNVDAFFAHVQSLSAKWGLTVSGPPKDHPWGEKSFLLIDPDKNRWEITQSPSEDGMLVNR